MLSVGSSTLATAVDITMTGIIAIVALEIDEKGGQTFKLVIRVVVGGSEALWTCLKPRSASSALLLFPAICAGNSILFAFKSC